MVISDGPINLFMSTDESIGDAVSAWTLFSHTGIYDMAIGLLIQVRLVIFCFLLCMFPHLLVSPELCCYTQFFP